MTERRDFVDFFRSCAPYIQAHRGRTFVIAVVAADHQAAPFWSSFLVIEMVERAD